MPHFCDLYEIICLISKGEAYFVQGLESAPRYYLNLSCYNSVSYEFLNSVATRIATNTLILVPSLATIFMDKNRSQYPYKLCEIRDRNSDLTKRWYIEFYVFDISTQKLVRKMDYSINSIKNLKARYKKAIQIAHQIDKKLKEGAFIDSSGTYKPKNKRRIMPETAFIKAVKIIFEDKATNTNSKRTINGYDSIQNIFEEWTSENGTEHISVRQMSAPVINEMLIWYKNRTNKRTGKLISNRTRNNFLMQVKSIFNDLMKREVIYDNPTQGIGKLKTSNKSHVPYMDDEAKKIKKYLLINDPQILLVCQTIYYLALRRSELRYLQVGHIRDGKIFLPESITHNGEEIRVSKSGKSQAIILPGQLKKMMDTQGIFNYPSRYFVFGVEGVPAENPTSIGFFTKRYKIVLEHLKMNAGQSLYSWKHTAACKLYQKFKDPKMIQEHFRHGKIDTTFIYMRNLGLFEKDELQEKYPDF